MAEKTYFIPFIKDGKVVTEDVYMEDVPDDGYWKFCMKQMDAEERRLAHLAENQDVIELYDPEATDPAEPSDHLVYNPSDSLLEQIRSLAEHNTAARDRTVTPE